MSSFWDCVFAKRTPDGTSKIKRGMTAMFEECGCSPEFIAEAWSEVEECLGSGDKSVILQCQGQCSIHCADSLRYFCRACYPFW